MDRRPGFLIVDTYYPGFLRSRYGKAAGLAGRPYGEQLEGLMASCFGTSDFYSMNLKRLGHEAVDVVANCWELQKKWADESGLRLRGASLVSIAEGAGLLKRLQPPKGLLLKVLEEQVKRMRPDVLYMQDLTFTPPGFLTDMRKYARLIAGQIASRMPDEASIREYDLILTSFPHYVERFRKMGVASEYFRIAFEPAVLGRVEAQDRTYDCTFVGGMSPEHAEGTRLLEALASSVGADFFGYGASTLDKASPVLRRHHGEVWGLDMYKTLLRSKVTVNRHIGVAEGFANNMRLFEATGCGAMLLTDWKENLGELFKVGEEVVAYRGGEELIDLARYYVSHDAERERIAAAGRQRTLTEHTYSRRMEELAGIIGRYLH